MKDFFESYHPFVNFLYFTEVIILSMSLNHPATQIISLFCAVAYLISAEGKKSYGFLLKFCIPAMPITAFINPAFNHEGVTILHYFKSGNPLTLESILYGISSGMMLVTVILWFSSFSRIMTSDKFIYLFGKVIPSLSLLLSMSLRFVPKFKKQFETVTEAQKCIGHDISTGSIWQRFKTAVVIFSIMITWALENAIETADSMKSRGYGLKGRTAFSIYRMDDRDKYALIWLGFCGLF
ncbi:MAG: energy-coupling factor transporter transmembrane protein EcfT, partial [Clostridia bacterium]|nr:energy-coupling factor transporter transmembrane protein EcfT [Clostridia bacterium]